MPYTVTKYPAGTFSWADVLSTDIEKTKTFMTELMGWTAQDMETGVEGMKYANFLLDGIVVAGGSAMPADMEGHPSAWNNYITVDSVDETIAKAVELGGQEAMPAMDVMDIGRTAGIMDPTGAAVMIWEPKSFAGAGVVNRVGAMGWNELYTPDLKKAIPFYTKLFGWTVDADGEFESYHLIKNNGRMNGGMMEVNESFGENWKQIPPHWLTYFTVASRDETKAKALELGGSVVKEMENDQVGKMAVIADPTGAMFMAIELSVPADEWVE